MKKRSLLSRMNARHLGLCVVFAAVAGLSGCGGGGGGGGSSTGGSSTGSSSGSSSSSSSSSTTTSPTTTPAPIDAASGFYDNANNSGGADVFSDTTNTTALHISDLEAMVKGKELLMMSVSENVAWIATLTSLSGTTYTADVRIYQNNVPYGTATLKGTLNAGTSITGTLTGKGYGQGTFSLDISTANNQQADVATIVRTRATSSVWRLTSNASEGFFIDSSGNVTNQFGGPQAGSFSGCTFAGTVTAVTNSALYQMQLTVSNCGTKFAAANGTYSGYATTRSASSPNDTLVVVLENSTEAYSLYGEFQ